MKIFVNGVALETDARGIAALLSELNQPAETTLVEMNGLALRRNEWPVKELTANDRIELLRIAAGG